MTTKTMRAATFGALLSAGAAMGGCAHRDAVGTVDNWYHQFQGGLIAQQRPPPPGVHDAYPHVGLTPTAPASVPSQAVRDSITESLIEQRNLTQRLAAANGALPTPPAAGPAARGQKTATAAAAGTASAPVPPKPGGATPAANRRPLVPGSASSPASAPSDASAPSAVMPTGADPSETGSNMTFDAPATPAPAAPAPRPARRAPTPTTDAPELAMPAVTVRPDTQDAAPPLPDMPPAPPLPPQFPGFAVPSDFHLPDAPRPAFSLTDPTGTLIRFTAGSDVMAGAQTSDIGEIISRRKGGTVYVRGFGEAQSLSGADQARGIDLALARALVVANALEARGVPASAIVLEADALGDGVRAGPQP